MKTEHAMSGNIIQFPKYVPAAFANTAQGVSRAKNVVTIGGFKRKKVAAARRKALEMNCTALQLKRKIASYTNAMEGLTGNGFVAESRSAGVILFELQIEYANLAAQIKAGATACKRRSIQ